ncbi:protocatechuate 3,4-dioxygenase [Sphingomonas crocodyli]|uniref:Protocatechuate 3,4-dioxygenase n=1 Tax=Sphingomonas crocodyli TaxID=1979270 RepID=A0A437M5I4_9SPHN|nr:protocatechuate 3,4-dioxygenase [Sphingomonas crocodyli]RVT92939.1 protocatechuate 3,4-dioxygenase [Sphingomonas crocodyli]
MGRIVGAFGMSHVMFPPKGVEHQAEAVLQGMLHIRERVSALRPDRLVLIGPDHFNNFDLALQIPLAIATSDRLQTLGDGGVPVTTMNGDRAFAEDFARFAAHADYDLVQAEEVIPDHGMAFPKLVVDPSDAVQTVLLYVNSGMPLPPSPARCHRLGKILRQFIECARPKGERVIVIGLGGLSHWLRMPGEGQIAQDFDQDFLSTLEQGGAEEFARTHDCAQIVELAGNGGLELLSWLVAAGAAGATSGQRIFYEPVAPWITGMAAIELFPQYSYGAD